MFIHSIIFTMTALFNHYILYVICVHKYLLYQHFISSYLSLFIFIYARNNILYAVDFICTALDAYTHSLCQFCFFYAHGIGIYKSEMSLMLNKLRVYFVYFFISSLFHFVVVLGFLS